VLDKYRQHTCRTLTRHPFGRPCLQNVKQRAESGSATPRVHPHATCQPQCCSSSTTYRTHGDTSAEGGRDPDGGRAPCSGCRSERVGASRAVRRRPDGQRDYNHRHTCVWLSADVRHAGGGTVVRLVLRLVVHWSCLESAGDHPARSLPLGCSMASAWMLRCSPQARIKFLDVAVLDCDYGVPASVQQQLPASLSPVASKLAAQPLGETMLAGSIWNTSNTASRLTHCSAHLPASSPPSTTHAPELDSASPVSNREHCYNHACTSSLELVPNWSLGEHATSPSSWCMRQPTTSHGTSVSLGVPISLHCRHFRVQQAVEQPVKQGCEQRQPGYTVGATLRKTTMWCLRVHVRLAACQHRCTCIQQQQCGIACGQDACMPACSCHPPPH
jgi:hypothetical protein